MYILNIAKAIKKITVKELKDFNFDRYHQQVGFPKENSYYSIKHQKKNDLFPTKLIKAEAIINESEIDDVFESIYTIISNIQKYLGKGLCWIIDSIVSHTINVSHYNFLVGSTYIKLPKELDHPRIGLINVQNINDNECLKWCLV